VVVWIHRRAGGWEGGYIYPVENILPVDPLLQVDMPINEMTHREISALCGIGQKCFQEVYGIVINFKGYFHLSFTD
jgi:hypothetical protein